MNNILATIAALDLTNVTGGLNTTYTPTAAQTKAEVAADKKYGYKAPKEPIVKHWYDAPASSTGF
jgi:hypothetical protein